MAWPGMEKYQNERIIIHLDYDCFYASVVENERPGLRSLPLGIQQKNILATCNYVARAQGVKKLQLVSEAKKTCPNLVIVNGEDLSRFRDASKKLWLYVREFIWEYKVERLGFDEVFLDVTQMIDFNIANLNLADFPASVLPTCTLASNLACTNADDDKLVEEAADQGIGFFRLSLTDPKRGFSFSWGKLPGHTYPLNDALDLRVLPESDHSSQSLEDDGLDCKVHNDFHQTKHTKHRLHRRLFLAAHFADFLRNSVKETYNYTVSAGISTTKLTAKLAGSVNKPDKQTLLIPAATQSFLDGHEIGKIPGVGFKTAQVLREELLGVVQGGAPEGSSVAEVAFYDKLTHPVTIHDIRRKLTLDRLSQVLDSKEQARKLYGWLHGVDTTPVAQTSLIPTQISIEDTFRSLKGTKQAEQVLIQLVTKLITRMHIDLLSPLPTPTTSTPTPTTSLQRWLACPRTFRLSLRPRDMTGPYSARISKSAPLPRYVFARDSCAEALAGRLVRDVGLPLLRKMGKVGEGELQLVNVAVVNMEESKAGEAVMAGVDIEKVFAGKKVTAEGSRNKNDEDMDWEKEVREIERVYKMLGEKGVEGDHKLAEEIDGISNEEDTIVDGQNLGIVGVMKPIDNQIEPGIGEDLWVKADDNGELSDMDGNGTDIVPAEAPTLRPIAHLRTKSRLDFSELEMEDEVGSPSARGVVCPKCGMGVLLFALEAHARFHEMERREQEK
ncbi:DNA/RNA polymerase [Terfezia boudieri ATCC MYA-4762]|uniref:DNA/RNA polymerase n=1 Tax=Terfezia boudieri ATCC MYA-4762 TaxID=1051890 RepID=A0A3N4M3Y4_9PEZI|nr:DNA/RNA polymerase [Terfezia boudieri ATCC MYA-4762]